MSRGLKIFLSVLGGVIVLVTLFFYFSLYGLPIKKTMVAKSIQKELAEKYDKEVELVGAVYNFKDGHYGGVYTIDDLEFYAEESDEEGVFDMYPNELWASQLIEDFEGIYQEVFPRGVRVDSNAVVSSEPEVEGPDLPRYDEVESWLTLDLTIDEAFDDDDHWEGIAEIVALVQEKSARISSSFLFVEEAKDRETFVTCPDLAEAEITSKEEAKSRCGSSIFTGEERRD